jgi:ABC-type nickel/cobalt efflux system permease component RcnA
MVESLIASSYLALVTIGLIHGLEPGHGWPVAAMLSTEAKRRYAYATSAGLILSAAHFISSLAVVVVYYVVTFFFGAFIDFTAPWFKILTAAILLLLAVRFFRQKGPHIHGPHGEHIMVNEEHTTISDGQSISHEEAHKYGLEHEHSSRTLGGKQIMSLKGLAAFALVLGFAHEEEFMLFALFVGGVNPLVGMSAYATAVTVALVGITLLAVKAFSTVESRMKKYQKYIPKVTGIVLMILAILFLLPVFGGPNVY